MDVGDVEDHDVAQLTRLDPESWSAFTIRVEENHLIVFNSSQSAPRRNSVVMHELAHIILGHELTSASLTEDGHFVPTTYNQIQEDEADWLAGALLLPRPALLKIRRLDMTDRTAMEAFMVSQQMLTWRFRMTGVDYQLANARRKWAG
ncbi:MAG: ImmA/IrrE family metallo-endopeptidase [Rhizobiaceae bacterium]